MGGCELHEEERNVLEEQMGKLDGFDVGKCGILDSSEKTIVCPGDSMWPWTAKQLRICTINIFFIYLVIFNVEETYWAANVGGVSIRIRNGAP